MQQSMRNQAVLGLSLAIVVIAELSFAWCGSGLPCDDAPAVMSQAEAPQACADQSAWFVCTP